MPSPSAPNAPAISDGFRLNGGMGTVPSALFVAYAAGISSDWLADVPVSASPAHCIVPSAL